MQRQSFLVLAQCMMSSQRIKKLVHAANAEQAIWSVMAELAEQNYYPLSATPV